MIETTILNYLQSKLNPVPVLMELPEVPSTEYPTFPDKIVTIELVGREKNNHVYTDSFAFQSHAQTLYEAAALDEEVRQAVEDMIELPAVGGVYLSSNYNHTDTRTKRYRYQCVYEINYV